MHCQGFQLLFEGGMGCPGFKAQLLDFTQFRQAPGTCNHSLRASRHYGSPLVKHIGSLPQRGICREGALMLPYGKTLSGKGGFLHAELLGLKQAKIGRHYVSWIE